jgi:hypothetical protein
MYALATGCVVCENENKPNKDVENEEILITEVNK